MPDMSGMMQSQMNPSQQPGQDQEMQGLPQGQPGATPQGGPAGPGPQPDPSQGAYGSDQESPDESVLENYLDFARLSTNIAKKLSKKKADREMLDEMGREIVEKYAEDEESRKDWMDRNNEWLKLAMLVRDNKVWPWPKASNIKYPLLATAAMQFSARAYPALVPTDGRIVKSKLVQKDPNDQMWQASDRITKHMSWQVLENIPDWEENMDKLLMTMAVSGICFKKTYYNEVCKHMESELVYPENLCINYWAKTVESAYRKTEILYYTDNDLEEKTNNDEEFLDLDFSTPSIEKEEQLKAPKATMVAPPPPGKSTPHVFLACHTYWDIDGDGYEEPYVITVHKATKQVVRIVARWATDGVYRGADEKVTLIKPIEYFTDFPFIPNPDGSVYALGFGLLLGPLNESANTLINQLTDAGTLANMPSGFIGKGLRLRIGQTQLQPGEFKVVNATGEDLQKSVYTMPIKEPSGVLMTLLNMIIDSGNKLASIAEIFVGKMPGQNTPATTTQETIQQGMAVFTAIYKRVYRSLKKEFQKIYFFNKISPDILDEESKLSGMTLQTSDYELPSWIIIPGADPVGDTATVRANKMQQVGQLLQMGTIDPMLYTKMTLDALELPNAEQLMKQPEPPPPDPKLQVEQAKQQTEQIKQEGLKQKQQDEQQKFQAELTFKEKEMALKERETEMNLRHKEAQAAMDARHKEMSTMLDLHHERMQAHQKIVNDAMGAFMTHAQAAQGMRHSEQQHQQGLQHKDQSAKQTLTLKSKAAAAAPKAPAK